MLAMSAYSGSLCSVVSSAGNLICPQGDTHLTNPILPEDAIVQGHFKLMY